MKLLSVSGREAELIDGEWTGDSRLVALIKATIRADFLVSIEEPEEALYEALAEALLLQVHA